MNTAQVLLVEDNLGDVLLLKKAFERAHLAADMSVVRDGEEAMAFLRKEGTHAEAVRPHLILLDLNLPRKDGREVLREIKEDLQLRLIPVVVLTSSEAETDVTRTYELHANSYITKPPTVQGLQDVLSLLHRYWFGTVRLPAIEA